MFLRLIGGRLVPSHFDFLPLGQKVRTLNLPTYAASVRSQAYGGIVMIDRDRLAMAERMRRTRARGELLKFLGQMVLCSFALVGFCAFIERAFA